MAQGLPVDVILDLGQPIPGVSNIWTVTTGGFDGKIYGGTSDGYPRSHMFIYNPATQSFTDLGNVGIEIYCLTTGKDSLIYGGSYKAPNIGAHFFVYNPKLPWNPGNSPANNPYDLGPAFPNPSIPSEAIIYDLATGVDGKIYGGTGYALVLARDYAYLFAYDPVTKNIAVIAFFQSELGVNALTVGRDGKVYGALTPSGKMFVYTPSTGNVTELGVPLLGNTIRDLTTGIDGIIYGGTMLDGHLIAYNPQTGSFSNIGKVVEYPGVWSITTGNNGRIYIGGANGHFVSFDPSLPWNSGTTPENNPRNYGEAVAGENRIRCLTVGKDNYIYGGTAHHAHLFVFLPRPIFMGHFMTPEKYPWPFDVIIADGLWRKEFKGVTEIVTEVPERATYHFIYERENKKSIILHREPFVFSSGTVRTFEFYALAPSSITDINRPYLIWQEEGANAVLTWETQNGILCRFVCAKEPGKQAGMAVPIDTSPNQLPNRIIVSQIPGVCCYPAHLCCWSWHRYYCHCDFCPVIPVLETIDSGGCIRIGHPLVNDAELTYPISAKLYDMTGKMYPQFFDPQYVVPEGNYILAMEGMFDGYLNYFAIPILVRDGVWTTLYKIYPQRISSLEPFTFFVLAEDYFDSSSYSNLTHNGYEISLDVNTQADHDWWGCFVLPDTVTVKDLMSYSDTILLGSNYDYTVTHVNNYTLITVRINSAVGKLSVIQGQIATIDIHPDILNLKSQGRWITGHIELPEGYNVNDINVETVELRYGSGGRVKAELHPTQVDDYDRDGIPDRMVKFSRQKVVALLSTVKLPFDADLQVVGNLLYGTPFAGTDVIRVISDKGGPQIAFTSPAAVPTVFSFSPAIPNPFRKETFIKYGLPRDCNVTLQVYDVTGRLVKQLVRAHQNAGFFSVSWDGKDDAGANLGSGVYFLKLQADEFIGIQRLILIR